MSSGREHMSEKNTFDSASAEPRPAPPSAGTSPAASPRDGAPVERRRPSRPGSEDEGRAGRSTPNASEGPDGPGGSGAASRPTGDRVAGEEPAARRDTAAGATEDEEDGVEAGAAEPTGRQRLLAALWPPRVTRGQVMVALLLCVLGLGLAIQVRSTSEHSVLRGARHEDLVRILSELDDRTERLEEEKRSLERQREELENSSDQAEEARRQTERRERQLGVLAGTVAAEGPGITLTISDPAGTVKADMLLDAIQELRAAGAEAIQVNQVRVVASTYLTDVAGGVRIDGQRLSSPYRFKVIGDPEDLEPALNIPGGVVQTLQKERATVSVVRAEEVIVDALRPAKRPDYARSSSQ